MSTVDKYPNWFKQTAQANFEYFLMPLAGSLNYRCMQIGAFTGDASVWLADNILTGEGSHLLDIDTWGGSKEVAHESMDFDDVYKIYKKRTEPYGEKITSALGDSSIYLQHVKSSHHFIYIDGDHTTVGVLLDAELSWTRLFPGGIMAFDDYTWNHESGDPRLAPKVGIDLFLHRHQGDYETLVVNTQVWIRKK